MSRLVRRVAFAALGLAFASLLRQLTRPATRSGKHALEVWENEGGGPARTGRHGASAR
jgi:hypothetical protein